MPHRQNNVASPHMASSSATAPSRPERRKALRSPFTGAVRVAVGDSQAVSAQLRDISQFGCNIKLRAAWLRVGRFVTLTFDEELEILAVIRWNRDDIAGLEFFRPLDLAQADWLDRGPS
jgi:hypothetical protein